MRFPVTSLVLAATLGASAGRSAGLATEDARLVAAAFGGALASGRAEGLRPLLPHGGKVRLVLAHLGPEEGLFGASQVEAVFREFLARGSVRAFEVAQCESDGKSSALAHARATVTDREGRLSRVELHLGLQPEDGRWVIREVKESSE